VRHSIHKYGFGKKRAPPGETNESADTRNGSLTISEATNEWMISGEAFLRKGLSPRLQKLSYNQITSVSSLSY
jgi:hypothetical protein